MLCNKRISISSRNYDLVLDIMPTENGPMQQSYHYYDRYETRCLFYLETYDVSHIISELYQVTSLSQCITHFVFSLPSFPTDSVHRVSNRCALLVLLLCQAGL